MAHRFMLEYSLDIAVSDPLSRPSGDGYVVTLTRLRLTMAYEIGIWRSGEDLADAYLSHFS